MPLIYKEKSKECNIMVFDFERVKKDTHRILYVPERKEYDPEKQSLIEAGRRSHPIFMFLNANGEYMCEVRYGGATANALQRGLWTNVCLSINNYFRLQTPFNVDYGLTP